MSIPSTIGLHWLRVRLFQMIRFALSSSNGRGADVSHETTRQSEDNHISVGIPKLILILFVCSPDQGNLGFGQGHWRWRTNDADLFHTQAKANWYLLWSQIIFHSVAHCMRVSQASDGGRNHEWGWGTHGTSCWPSQVFVDSRIDLAIG